MNAFETTQAITLLANYIARQCPEHVGVLGTIFSQLGDTLSTIAAVNDACQKKATPGHKKSEPTPPAAL